MGLGQLPVPRHSTAIEPVLPLAPAGERRSRQLYVPGGQPRGVPPFPFPSAPQLLLRAAGAAYPSFE